MKIVSFFNFNSWVPRKHKNYLKQEIRSQNAITLFFNPHLQDKEYLRKECENYRLSNLKLESRLQKMEAKLSPNSAALINKITELEETTEVRIVADICCFLGNVGVSWGL